MNITITGRRMEVTPSLKEYAEKKIIKLEKYFHQLIDAHVILHVDKLDHVAEVLINGDGVQFHGIEKGGDMYSAVDLLIDKMEKQVNKYKEKHSGHKANSLSKNIEMDLSAEKGVQVMLSQAKAKPIDEIEAYLEMKLDKRDFILFKKGVKDTKGSTAYANKNYAVIFRQDDSHRMVEIPYDMIKENKYVVEEFSVFDLNVIDDSLLNPKIKLKKNKNAGIKKMTIDDAMREIENHGAGFIPFFNSDTNYINIIHRSGKKYEVIVPAF
jgi:putative sigma-54 modulation protein